ncbi:MAG: hypothetical protein KatS3mg087_1145 [Patescibacteria group bacterium]|nr:MAG: hypothetical protein KatS3mg087_1145 [Patescibacteria group bacterium]
MLNKLDNQNEKQQNNNLAEQKIENANGHKADSLFPEMHEIITIGKTQIDLSKIDFPENCKTEEIKQAIIDWLTYRSKIKKPYKCPEQQISLLLKEFKSDFPKCVNNSIANGYQGCFPPRKSKNEIDYYAL